MDLQKTNLGKVAITVDKDYYDSTKDYDRLVVVEVKDIYKTYISRKPVPAGTNINNREYWIPFSSLSETALIDYNKHLSDLTDELAGYIEQIEDNTTNINSNDEDIANIQKEQKVQNDDIKNNNTLITTYFKTYSTDNLDTAFYTGFYPKTKIGTPTLGTYNAFVVKASTKSENDNAKTIIQIARCIDGIQINRIFSRLCIFDDENKNHTFTSWEELSNKTVVNLITELEQKVNNVVAAYNKKNKANGLVELNSSGLIPSNLLPSFVDDVLEYDNKEAFPSTGEQGKIYVDKATSRTYRWSGTTYIQINQLELGETSSTAYAGDKGKALKDWQDNKDATLPEKFITNIGNPTSSNEGIRIPITSRFKDASENSDFNVYLTPATNTNNGILSKSDKQLIDNVRYLENISHILDNNAFSKTSDNVSLNFKCRNIVNGTPAEHSVPIGAATTTKAGVMTAADKTKLDGLSNYTLPVASKTVLGGVKEKVNEYTKTVSIDSDGILSTVNSIDITYQHLKSLRDNSNLIPGRFYRIVDYSCETTIGFSMHNRFDIIVVALTNNKLSEEAYAIQHVNDTYFTSNGCDLTKWKIWYCLDNDTNRFEWADTANGRGVIYRMIDEYGNEAPYDFKNIKTTHNILYNDTTNDSWIVEGIKLYTFSYVEKLDDSTNTIMEDVSVTQRYPCRNNKIGPLITTIENDYNLSTKQTINNITFVINKDIIDYFGSEYSDIYIDKGIICNNILTDCYNCCFGTYTYNNKIHNSSVYNYFKISDCSIENSTITLYMLFMYKTVINNSDIEVDSNFNIYEHLLSFYLELGIINYLENNIIYDTDINGRYIDILGANIATSKLLSSVYDENHYVSAYNSNIKNALIRGYNQISITQSDICIISSITNEQNDYVDISYSTVFNTYIYNDESVGIDCSVLKNVNGKIRILTYSTLISAYDIDITDEYGSSYIINNCMNTTINNTTTACTMTMSNLNFKNTVIFENIKGRVNVYIDSSNELIIENL